MSENRLINNGDAGSCRLLDVSTTAKRLGVSVTSVYRLKYKGIIQFVTTGPSKGYKVREPDLDDYKYRRDNDLLE